MENNQQYKSLLDMGCNPVLCQAAIKSTKSQDIMALLDWISSNQDKEDHWKKWLQQHKNQPEAEKQEGGTRQKIPIQTLVKPEQTEELMKKGYSKTIAQKALLLSNNMGVGLAQKWIEDHKYDPDFEEQVVIEGQPGEEKPQMTPEQAKQKLQELTKKARAIKKQRQEEEALEREKNRMRYGKEMIEAKRIAEEQAMKRQVELDKIQKEKDQAYKRQLVQQMRRERNERLGIKEEPGSTNTVVQPKKQQPKYTKVEQVELQCEQVKVGNHAYPQRAKTFFQTANIYVNNIIKNNGEEKYRKINKQNKAFQNRILTAFGGQQTLMAIGYQQDGSALIMHKFDLKELGEITKILQRYLSYYA